MASIPLFYKLFIKPILRNLYLLYLLPQLERNVRLFNPIYKNIEAKITETPYKGEKMPMCEDLNKSIYKIRRLQYLNIWISDLEDVSNSDLFYDT